MISNRDMYFIDLDKLFENFADKYYNEHEDEYDSPDDFAKDLDKIYHAWATSPAQSLGGISPSEFFNHIPVTELVGILKESCIGDRNPNSLLFDRIATEPDLIDELQALALSSDDEKLLTVTMSLIAELGGADSSFYLEMTERDIADDVKEQCVEMLCDRADEARDDLLERAAQTDDVKKLALYAEPLTFCEKGDDDILAVLRRLLAEGDNIAYAAALMGRYGDERAADDLYPLLDTCNFAEFMEIRCAIEQLGGTVDDHYRDFSDDPLYRVLKGNNKK